MGKAGSTRRKQKQRRAERSAQAAARAVATAKAAEAFPVVDPVTDISHLRVSPEDVIKAGTATPPMRWRIARCSVQAEARVMRALQERRIAAYLPMHRFYRWPRGRKVHTERPLLVGYLFVGLAAHQDGFDFHAIDGIEGLLKRDGVTAQIDPWAVVQIAAMEASGAFDHTGARKAFAKGQLVKVVSGWAMGHEATVVEDTDGGLRVQFDDGIFNGSPVPIAHDHVEAVDAKEAA